MPNLAHAKLILPVVEHLVTHRQELSLEGVRIIGVQHILETTHAMFRSLYQLGLKPGHISLLGKCYSTNRAVFDEMRADGIDVSEASFKFDSHSSFDEVFNEEVKTFLDERIGNLTDAHTIVVLDDGGKCIQQFAKQENTFRRIVAIEQTSAGYEAIKNLSLPFPVVNVARSPAKLSFESPMIAQAAGERLERSLEKRALKPVKALVMGGGAIGQAVRAQLKVMGIAATIFDEQESLSEIKTSLHDNLSSSDMIVGCTGKTSVPAGLHVLLNPGSILVSVSSSDREFDAVAFRRQHPAYLNPFQDIVSNEILLINSGFPVNFDGERENISTEKIQLTLGLIAAAILQAIQLPEDKPNAIFSLDAELECVVVNQCI